MADDRYIDLLKQGFMKSRKVKRVREKQPVVTCDDCMNWHEKGRHTADAATRKARRDAARAKKLGNFAGRPGKIDCGSSSAEFCRERQFDPAKCQPGSFRTIQRGSTRIVVCRVKGSSTTRAQSILRPKNHSKCRVCTVR